MTPHDGAKKVMQRKMLIINIKVGDVAGGQTGRQKGRGKEPPDESRQKTGRGVTGNGKSISSGTF
jgi:hypothetical protein